MRTRRRNQEGTTLIETLAAITLFAIVAAGVAAMSTSGMRMTSFNRQATSAQLLASEELEQLRGMSYVDMASRSYSQDVANQHFDVSSVVTANVPAAGMKHIVVTVSWDSHMGARSYELETIFTSVE